MSYVIGIDLGTTNCCVSVVRDGKPEVLANRVGYKTTPSMVAVTNDQERLVGQLAARQAVTNPTHTVYATKRLIGRAFDAPQVQHAARVMPFKIVEGQYGEARVIMRGREYTIPEISAFLLQEMRVVAEGALGESIEQAVVTVPAYFTDSQRQAVMDAGLIAGLDVLRILNEPTAAALGYGYTRREPRVLAVYDLGGGTFDVSIVRVHESGSIEVVSTTGDAFLGGEDWDERIKEWMLQRFLSDESVDLSAVPVALQRIKQAAQKAKCDLSSVAVADVNLPFIHNDPEKGPMNMMYALTRQELEDVTGDLVKRTLDICSRALQLAFLEPNQIDEVLLVGGMTRMPLVQQKVAEFFGRQPSKGVHPDEVVAIGAAIQGAILNDDIDEVQLEDVTAHSLGIATAGDQMDILIPANSKVPIRIPSVFTTNRRGQERLKIIVLQGEEEKASKNEILKDFQVTGLRPAPAGELDIEVAFEIDGDGIFRVSAKDLETGKETSVEITDRDPEFDDRLEAMREENQQQLQERRREEANERLRQSVETLIYELKRTFPGAERWLAGDPEGAMSLAHARCAVAQAEGSLGDGDRASLADHVVVLEDAMAMVNEAVREAADRKS